MAKYILLVLVKTGGGCHLPMVNISNFKGDIMKITTKIVLNGSKVAKIEVLHEALGAFCQMLEISEYPRWLPHLILTAILDFIAQIYKIIIKMIFLIQRV